MLVIDNWINLYYSPIIIEKEIQMAFKVLGITDEITVCDCCGKTNLKCTVALESDDGGIVHYGRDCAGKAVFGSKNAKNTKLIHSRAAMIQKCKDILPVVKNAMMQGKTAKEINKIIPSVYHVSFGTYSDTGNKMPLRIYYEAWTFPGVDISPNDY